MPMDPLRPGDPTRVGDYVLTARLGAGGMGEVFFGRSPGGRPVAVKLVHPVYAADGEFRRRFKREVEAARTVGGFHTAPVVDADPDADRPWMVTAYVAGPSLAEALAGHGPLPAATLRTLGAGLADALKAIHKERLIHRDLKPSNILLAADGPRVIDFGIARAVDASGVTARVGTPGFMSPELLTGQALTPACDVFALGLVLAHAAGARPFGDGPVEALNYRIVHQDPDLTGLDGGLADVVHACLAKDPADRPTPAALIGLLSDGGDPGAWLPADLQTMVTTRLAPTIEAPASGPRTPSHTPFDGGVVYQTTLWKNAVKDFFGGLGGVAFAGFCCFPGVIHGYFYPNSFSPHPLWGITGGALFGLPGLAFLYDVVQGKKYERRLVISPSGLDATVGKEHNELEWGDVARVTVMRHQSKYQPYIYIYPNPDWSPPKNAKKGPGNGWVPVCPINEFGTPRQIIMKALAHYAGPAWEPPPAGDLPLRADSADVWQPDGPDTPRS
jgi:eukaryotic-like serine/threonine-protein kinase